MDQAYVDKIAENINGVNYLIVRQLLFHRTLNAKRMKTKEETIRAFSTMLTRKVQPKKLWVDKETEFAGVFSKVCKAEGIQVYSTISEIMTAFAERTTRSLKIILYCYMEYIGYEYIDKVTQFITTLNCRTDSSKDLISKVVKCSDFLSILCSKSLREYQKHKFRVGDKLRSSRYDLLFRMGYAPQKTEAVSDIVAIYSTKPPTSTKKDEKDVFIPANFYQKESDKVVEKCKRLL